ncbi:MAG: hypothetical protein QXG91_04810 [Candidatus Aenigmatarchaeota archaeon]
MQKLKILVYVLILSLSLSPFIEFFSFEYLLAQTNVSVTATVSTSVTCTLATTTTAFGNIDTNNVYTSSPNVTTTVSCNPGAGCTVTIKDAGDGTNGGLYKSTAPTYLIPSPASGFPATSTLTAGTDGYGVQAATTTAGSGGTLSLNSIYTYSGNTVGKLATTTQTLASSSQPVSNREVVVTHKSAVSGLAPAGSYQDTITYSCASN